MLRQINWNKNSFLKVNPILLIVMLIVLFIFPVLLFFTLVMRESYSQVKREAMAESLHRAQVVSTIFDKLLNGTLVHVQGHESLLARALVSNDPKLVEDELGELYESSNEIEAVELYTPEAKEIYRVPYSSNEQKKDFSKTKWFKDYIKAGRRSILTDISESEINNSKKNVVMIVHPIYRNDKEIAVVNTVMSINSMQKWIENVDLPRGAAFAVLDKGNHIVIASGQFSKTKLVIGQKVKGVNLSNNNIETSAGNEAFIKVVPINGRGWNVATWQSKESITSEFNAQNVKYLTIFLFLTVIGIFLALLSGKYQRKNIDLMNELQNQLDKQQNIVSTLQKNLAPKLPQDLSLDIYAKYISATDKATVGGDFFEVIPLTSDKIIFAIGDVSGKGIDAAVSSAMIRYMLRTIVTIGLSPAKILKLLNAAVAPYFEKGSFATMVCALYDKNKQTLTISRAGHYHPILNDGPSDKCNIPSLPLGIFPTSDYQECEHIIEKDECVLFFTDGLVEARRGDDFYNLHRLEQSFFANNNFVNSVEEIVEAIYQGSYDHCNGDIRDDVALIAFKA